MSSNQPGISSGGGEVLPPPDGDSIAALQRNIAAVEQQIRSVEADIKKAEEKIETGCNNEADTQYWREEKKQLREKEKQLRKEKEQLRDDLREEKKQQQLQGKAHHCTLHCATICIRLSRLDVCSAPSQLVDPSFSLSLSVCVGVSSHTTSAGECPTIQKRKRQE